MRRVSQFKLPFGQAFESTLFVVIYAVFNTRKHIAFGFTQGFPFTYAALGDDAQPPLFNGMAIFLNLLIGFVSSAVIWKYGQRHRIRCSAVECVFLAFIAAAFTWADLVEWYGWRPTIWGFFYSRTVAYGFPFIYATGLREAGPSVFHEELYILNWTILSATLAMVSQLFHHATRLPNTPLQPTAEKRGG